MNDEGATPPIAGEAEDGHDGSPLAISAVILASAIVALLIAGSAFAAGEYDR